MAPKAKNHSVRLGPSEKNAFLTHPLMILATRNQARTRTDTQVLEKGEDRTATRQIHRGEDVFQSPRRWSLHQYHSKSKPGPVSKHSIETGTQRRRGKNKRKSRFG